MMPQSRTEESGNGWSEYQKLVLSKLQEHGDKLDEIAKEQAHSRVELALIKQRSGFWGAVAGTSTAVLTLAIAYLKQRVGGA
jgi:hypothetical protein